MSFRSHIKRSATGLAAGLVPAAALLGFAGSASAAPAELPQQQIAAIAQAGTVYVSGTWSGYVEYSAGDWSPLMQANFSCSGFVASSDGYVVTAGHCADVAEGRKALIDEFLVQAVQQGLISQSEASSLVQAGVEDAWKVEGKQSASQPVLAAKVYPAMAISQTGNFKGYDATVVDDRPLSQGDVALLKIDPPTPLPVLQVASAQPASGDTIDAVGYPGNVTQLVSDSVQPTFAKGQVSGRQQTQAGPFTQVGVSMSPGMSGGPVVNGQGEVVGTVSFGPSADTQQLNFASTLDNVQALLNRNGVKNTLSQTDQTFRKGLTEFFAGQFHAAAQDMQTVLSADPTNSLALKYKNDATTNFPNEKAPAPAKDAAKKGSSMTMYLIIGGAAVGIIVVGGVVLVLVRRRRSTPPATATAAPVGPFGPVGPVSSVSPMGVPAEQSAPTWTPPAATAVPAPVSAPAYQPSGTTGTALLEAPAAPSRHAAPGFCPNCGTQHAPDARFCAGCGHTLG